MEILTISVVADRFEGIKANASITEQIRVGRSHAKTVGNFFHRPFSELQSKLLLTGSAEDEMFPKGHYEELFHNICSQNSLINKFQFVPNDNHL